MAEAVAARENAGSGMAMHSLPDIVRKIALNNKIEEAKRKKLAAGVLGLAVNDSTAGFRAYRASMLRQIDLEGVVADGYGFQIEMAYAVRNLGEQVVEIAFDGLQRSTRYPGGLALRFARVLRYRDDKTADEADTIDTVRSLATP